MLMRANLVRARRSSPRPVWRQCWRGCSSTVEDVAQDPDATVTVWVDGVRLQAAQEWADLFAQKHLVAGQTAAAKKG